MTLQAVNPTNKQIIKPVAPLLFIVLFLNGMITPNVVALLSLLEFTCDMIIGYCEEIWSINDFSWTSRCHMIHKALHRKCSAVCRCS